MPTTNVNGVQLFYQASGQGEVPLILTHGSWGSHHDWDAIVPGLAESFQVIAYDRRGHSQSADVPGQGSITGDVDDLAALIEDLDLAPAWVLGHSYGASIVLRLAGRRPDLLEGVIAHDAPLLSLIADDPDFMPILDEVNQRVGAVVERIATGDHAGAAQQFFNEVALGPGAWQQLPPAAQQTFITNAPTFLDEAQDPEQLAFDLAWVEAFDRPCFLTTGENSPPFHAPVHDLLVGALPNGQIVTVPGAGHIPQMTHPEAYVAVVAESIHSNSM